MPTNNACRARALFRWGAVLRTAVITIGFSMLCARGLHAQNFRCQNQKHLINLSINNSGETVTGPVCAQILINALRYSAAFGKAVTYSAGPNLSSIFPSSFSAGGGGAETSPTNLNAAFQKDSTAVKNIQLQVILQESRNRSTGSDTDQYLTKLNAMITQSDDQLATNGVKSVLSTVQGTSAMTDMQRILTESADWKNTDTILTSLQQIQADLNALPATFPQDTGTISGDACGAANLPLLGWNSWDKCNDSAFKLLQSQVAALITDAGQWTSDSSNAAQFAKKVGLIQYWKDLIAGLSEASFTMQSEIRCGLLSNQNQQTDLKLILADRTSLFGFQQPQPQTKDALLNIQCSSPFAISGGAAFSTIRNQQFAIVQSTPVTGSTAAVSTFGTTSDSRVNPYPIAMAHGRLCDWNDNRYALHFSFGVGANIQGQSSGGSSPEFLTGLSISFLRTIFLTGGLDVGKESKLAGGFSVGETVPTNVTSTPVSSSYKAGFGFAVTFTKP
jgi:hypothetical protein